MEIRGVKIIMMDMDQKTAEKGNDDPAYGIKKVEMFRPG